MHYLIPQFIVDHYQKGMRHGRLFAACLFVDISGFSAITDSLMKHGPHGAETLAGLMRTVFTPLIGGVYEYGGFVATLAGDAFTAVFPAEGNSGFERQDAASRSITAAWQIQRRMQQGAVQSTVYGNFDVSAKVGAACGEVNWGIATSDNEQRAAYYFEGPAIDASAWAEHAASAGEIVLSAELLDLVEPLVAAGVLGEGQQDLYRLLELGPETPASGPVSPPQLDVTVLSRFFPAEIVHQAHSGEFRQIISLFISLPTVRTEDQLAIFMRSVFSLQDRYGGLLNRVDFGDKGSNLLLFWGAPATYENDVARALNFILALQANTSIPINAGVTCRIAHAGFVGSPLREEYTCYGRGVNLAARFMTAAARGEIWLDEHVARQAERQFDIEFEGQMSFKGFAEEQKVYVLFEAKEDNEILYDRPMVGRQAEMEVLAGFVEPLWQGRPAGTMIVWGDPGMGKSRLVHEFGHNDKIVQEDVLWALCQSDEILRESFNPFRYWLKRYFSQSVAQSEPRNKRNFNRKLDGLIADTEDQGLAAELDRTRSFLGAMLDLYWPDSLHAGLDASGRYENTLRGLQVLMQAESLRQPLIIQLEDLHWLDEASREYIVRLASALQEANDGSYPIALIATSRREGPGCPLPQGEYCSEIDLARLSGVPLHDLASDMLGGPISQPLLEFVESRAEGNPFFAEQILRFLEEADLLLEGEDGWRMKMEQRSLLPDDVRSVLNARLDRLTQEVKDVVQTAAVLGREFEVTLLIRMLRDEQVARERIAVAENAAIWSALSQVRYLFKHALLRDTAYQMQVRSRRQALHQLAVEALESLYADDLRPHYAELAYHSDRAGQDEAAANWYLLAAEQSERRGALLDARNYLDRATDLMPVDNASQRWLALSRQIEVLSMLGDAEASKKKAGEALALAQELADDGLINKSYLQLGSVAHNLGNYQEALDYLDTGLDASARVDQTDTEALLLAMKTVTLARLGRTEEAAKVAKRALLVADTLDDDLALIRILINLANFNMSAGDFGRAADLLGRQIDINRRLGARVGEAHGLTNLAYNQLMLGLYRAAQETITQALQLTTYMGAMRLSAYNRLNLGMAQTRLNRPADARREIEAARKILIEVDDNFAVAASYTYMGMALEGDGQLVPAAASFGIATDMMQKMGAAGYAIDAVAGRCRCALRSEDKRLAERLATEIWDYLRQSGPGGLEFPLLAYESCVRVFEATENTPLLRASLEAGYHELMEWARRISSAEWRESFLQNVPENRILSERWRRLDR